MENGDEHKTYGIRSPLTRGAWIEILGLGISEKEVRVAPHARGVD